MSPVQGAGVAEDRAAPLADEKNQVDPEDAPPLAAPSLAQAHAFPASPTPAAGFRTRSRERLAKTCPGRPAPAAAPGAAALPAAEGPNARNPVHLEDGWAWPPAVSH
jgi:hypothetical protein